LRRRHPRRQVQVIRHVLAQFRQLGRDGDKPFRVMLVTGDPMEIGRGFQPGRDVFRRRISGQALNAMQDELGHKIKSQILLHAASKRTGSKASKRGWGAQPPRRWLAAPSRQTSGRAMFGSNATPGQRRWRR
jgi:hypothetical protein